jgi:hypothetical protein
VGIRDLLHLPALICRRAQDLFRRNFTLSNQPHVSKAGLFLWKIRWELLNHWSTKWNMAPGRSYFGTFLKSEDSVSFIRENISKNRPNGGRKILE